MAYFQFLLSISRLIGGVLLPAPIPGGRALRDARRLGQCSPKSHHG